MTNLKRVLSLALASVMLIGMMVIGASAANIEYTDGDDIENTVAVTVLTGMDVLGGYPDGSFRPEANITRAEAAAIVCRIMLGADIAESLTTDTDPFEDVDADNWAAGYIAYLRNLGIVSGIGNNKFNPQGQVTVGQMARMLLGAAGITGQYTGSNWLINVTIDARNAGILSSRDAVSEPATRDQVALYTFNTLSVGGETSAVYVVTKGNTVLYRGTEALTALLMYQANDGSTLTLSETSDGSLGDTVFGLTVGTTTDKFGRKSTVYTNGETGRNQVVYGTFAPTALLTYTSATTYGRIVSALGYTSVNDTVTLNIYDNSARSTAASATRTSNTPIGGQGTSVQVYAAGTDSYDVVVVDTYVAELDRSDIHAAKAATAVSDAVPAYIDLPNNLAYETSAFKAGDVVLYTVADGAVVNVVAADAVSGTVTATANGYFRVNGTQMYLSANNNATIGSTDGYRVGTSLYTYYLDFYGNVIYAKAGQTSVAVETSYIYVIATAARVTVTESDNLFGSSSTSAIAQAQVIDLETGTISVVNLGIVRGSDGNYYYANMNGSASNVQVTNNAASKAAGIYAYATLADGSIVLANAPAEGTDVTVQRNVASLGAGNGFATSGTTLTVVEYTTTNGAITSATVTTTTGIANFPAQATEYKDAILVSNNGVVSEILVVKAASAPVASVTYAVYGGAGETVLVGNQVVTTHVFYVNGKAVTYYMDNALVVGAVYGITVTNNTVAAANPVSALKSGTVTYIDNTFVVIDNTVYYLANGCLVVDADSTYAVDTLAVGDNVSLYGAANAVSLVIIDN